MALASSHEAYQNAFQTYKEKSTLSEAIKDYCREAAAHIMQKTTHSVPVFRVLGVGSGDGKPDIEILQAIARSLSSSHDENLKPSIHACIVEPSSSIIEEFKEAVSPLPEGLATLADVSFEWRETTFQDLIASSSPESKRYQMVYFVASVFYMDAEETLKYCFRNLANGGAMFCLVAGAESYFVKQSQKFQGKLKGLSDFYMYTGDDLVAIAKRNSWSYEELPKAHYDVDITSCFDKSSQTGSLLLDFLTHQVDFRTTADPELLNQVIDFIRSEVSTCDNDADRKVLRSQMAAVIIYKMK